MTYIMDDLIKLMENISIVVGFFAVIGIIYTFFVKIYKLTANVDRILKEVTPNSGGSIKDKINKIEKELNDNSMVVKTICARQKWLLDRTDDAVFECDDCGKCTWVNEKYCNLLKHDVDFFLDNGWKTAVHAEDLERVEREWDKAVKDGRNITTEYRMVDRDGTILKIKASATKTNENGFIGTIKVL